MNKVILLGNLVADPEIKYTAGGAQVANLRLAVNEGKKREPLFVNLVAYDKLAEVFKNYTQKGKQVLVEGRLVIRQYEGRDGGKRQATEVVLSRMDLLGSREGRQEDDPSAPPADLPF